MNRLLRRYRWWHRIRGHRIGVVTPDFSDLAECSKVRERCDCGDQWLFFGFGLYEQYIPAWP